MIDRLLALLGVIAFGVRRVIGAILSLIGLGGLARYAVPALIVAFAGLAALTARETAAILEARPEVTQTTLAEVAADDGEGSVWFEFDALVDDSFLPTPADFGTFFYLARDPADPGRGLLVRSPLNDLFFRQRFVTGTLTEDPDQVADTLARFGAIPSGISVDAARYLDETGVAEPREEALDPSDLRGPEAGTEALVVGRVVSPAAYGVCGLEGGCDTADPEYLYLFAEVGGGSAIVLRSPHPPDAIPVRLQGLHVRDTYDLGPVLASDWYSGLDAEVPTARAFAAGSEPPITVPASWVPTLIFGAVAAILLASQLVGYPVFARGAAPAPRRTLAPGDEVPVLITGQLWNARPRVTLDRAPGAVQRLAPDDLATLMWRYGLTGDLSRREAEDRFARDAGAADRLVVHERDQSALVLVERTTGAVAAEPGDLYRVVGRAPAVRFRQGASRAYLTTRTAEDRDRIAAEVAAEASGAA